MAEWIISKDSFVARTRSYPLQDVLMDLRVLYYVWVDSVVSLIVRTRIGVYNYSFEDLLL